MRRNLRGDPTDLILLLVILFFITISLVIALYVNNILLDDIISNTVLNQSEAYDDIQENFTTINEYVVQRAFTVFFGLLIIGILVSSFLIRVHPVFLFIYIFTLGIAIFVSIYLANTYELIVSNPEFASFAANYATMTWVMSHVAQILLGTGALSMIIIFGKLQNIIGGGNQSQTDL